MDQIPNDGVILKDHPISGNNTFEVRNTTGVWPTPNPENQFCPGTDTMACVSYSAVHCIESQILFFTGQKVDFSERFLAKMSGTTHQGNWQEKVFETIQQYGLVLDSDWPEPLNFTWDTYYADIPQEIIAKGKERLARYVDLASIGAKWVTAAEVADALKEAPLQAVITAENPVHAVLEFDQTQYFDTYPNYVKALPSVHDYLMIKVKPLITIRMNLSMTPDQKTFFLEGDKGKIGIADPDSLALIQSLTSEQPGITNANIPEVQTLSHGFIINKKA